MGRKAQLDLIGNIIQIIQVFFDHPFFSLLILTGIFSGLQAVFNGSIVDVFRLTIWNLFALFDFFLTDLTSICIGSTTICLPSFFVSIFNFVKLIAFGGIVVKEALPIWLQLWGTSAQVANLGKR